MLHQVAHEAVLLDRLHGTGLALSALALLNRCKAVAGRRPNAKPQFRRFSQRSAQGLSEFVYELLLGPR